MKKKRFNVVAMTEPMPPDPIVLEVTIAGDEQSADDAQLIAIASAGKIAEKMLADKSGAWKFSEAPKQPLNITGGH
jgi:hypothetical protein